jgi:maltose phosphorylase
MNANWDEKFWEPLEVKHIEMKLLLRQTFKTHSFKVTTHAKAF